MDFQQFISDVEASYKPQCDYSQLPHLVLIITLYDADFLGHQCVARILAAKKPDWSRQQVLVEAHKIASKPSPDKLASLYQIYPFKEPLAFLVELFFNRIDISREMWLRTERCKLGRAIVKLETRIGQESFKEFRNLLYKCVTGGTNRRTLGSRIFVQNKPHDYRERRDIAIEGVFDTVKKLKKNAIGSVTGSYVPSLPSGLNVPEAPDWLYRILVQQFKMGLELALRTLLPILNGEAEKAKEGAHEKLKSENRKGKAQKRSGKSKAVETISLDEAIGWELDSGNQLKFEGVWRAGDGKREILELLGTRNYVQDPEAVLMRSHAKDEPYPVELLLTYEKDTTCPEEYRHILEVCRKNKWNISAASKEIEISRPTLYKRLEIITNLAKSQQKTNL